MSNCNLKKKIPPATKADHIRARSRATTQRLSSSYIRHRRKRLAGCPPVDSKTTHSEDQGPAIEQSASVISPALVLLETHSLDVTMAESTLVFGDTMRLYGLGGGAVTPPQCATSIPIPAEMAKAIAEEIKQSPSTQLTSTCPIADTLPLARSADTLFHGWMIQQQHPMSPPRKHPMRIFRRCVQPVSERYLMPPQRRLQRRLSLTEQSNVPRIPQWYAAGPASTKVWPLYRMYCL